MKTIYKMDINKGLFRHKRYTNIGMSRENVDRYSATYFKVPRLEGKNNRINRVNPRNYYTINSNINHVSKNPILQALASHNLMIIANILL